VVNIPGISRLIPAAISIWEKDSQGKIIEIRYFEKKEVNNRNPLTIKGWVNNPVSIDFIEDD
jgi:hypothetical protein